MAEAPLLALKNVRFAHPGGPALFSGLSFSLYAGQALGLYGPNGCGKTTLLRLLVGLLAPKEGQLFFHGEEVKGAGALHRLRCAVGLVLQESDDQLFSPTVLEDVAFGPLNLGLTRAQAKERAMQTLETLKLTHLAARSAHGLSGGEKKLAAIASVLAMRPEVLLLDEPSAFVDETARRRIIEALQAQPAARLVVSHDADFLRQTAGRLMRIQAGRLEEAAELAHTRPTSARFGAQA